MTSSAPNPYSSPHEEGPQPPASGAPSADGVVTATVVLTERDVAPGIALTTKQSRTWLPLFFGLVAFWSSSGGGIAVQLAIGGIVAIGGWLVWPKLHTLNARRALANKSEDERTVHWHFSRDQIEQTTSTSYVRMKWAAIHRHLEGSQCFVLYVSEAVVHVLPKRFLRAEDVPALRALFAERIVARKRPSALPRLLLAWALLIIVFLAIWQWLQMEH